MANVYAWPPVRAIAREWSVLDPVSRSKSLITGGEYVSQSQRRRRVASLLISSKFTPMQAGMGYMEALKRYLKGGVHLVRLNYRQTPRCFLPAFEQRGGNYFDWFVPPGDIDWTVPPTALNWFNGVRLPYVGGGDPAFPSVTVRGLPPSRLVVLPGEFVVVWQGDIPTRMMVMNPATTDATGTAVIRLEAEVPVGDRISLGDYDTGVFAADAMPRTAETAQGDPQYQWSFTEVFADEGRGPFVEVNPWI